MDKNEFKKTLQICTGKVGFKHCKNNYCYKNEKIVVLINIQKSHYAESYYINYGFWIKVIHGDSDKPKISDCDIIGRFINTTNITTESDFQLSGLDADKLTECFNSNINNIIIPVINKGIKKYFALYPDAIFAAKQVLKEYLGYLEA